MRLRFLNKNISDMNLINRILCFIVFPFFCLLTLIVLIVFTFIVYLFIIPIFLILWVLVFVAIFAPNMFDSDTHPN